MSVYSRRDHVNDRLTNQSKRITDKVKEGDMAQGQAHKLRKEDHQIRQ